MERYYNERTYDPDLSEKGVLDSLNIGVVLKEKKIKIDRIYTSAFKRNLHTAKLFRESYGDKDLKIHLMIKLHEKSGCNMKGKCYPGLGTSQVKEIIPDIVIDEYNSKLIDENGWFKNQELETNEESLARVKEMVKELKESYQENKGKTILCITHGAFLNDILCTYTNNVNNAIKDYFICDNHAFTIMDFKQRRDENKQKDYIDAKLLAFNVKLISE